MAVQVYGCNHVVIEVTDAKKAVKFYQDVFGLKMLRGGEGAAWCKLGEHQFMAIFEVDKLQRDRSFSERSSAVSFDFHQAIIPIEITFTFGGISLCDRTTRFGRMRSV